MLRQAVRSFSTTRTFLQSSCKEGTKIDLNIYKNGKPIVALKDEEYPEWLWGLLDKDLQLEQLKNEDPFRYNRKIIKKQNIARIKMKNFMQNM
jgi:large subunit ribosomal protein L54